MYQSDISQLPLEIARVVEAFAHGLANLVDDTTGSTDEGWNSRFFETIRPSGVVRVFVCVREDEAKKEELKASASSLIKVEFSKEKLGFVIWIPKQKIGQTTDELLPILTDQTCDLFWVSGKRRPAEANDGLEYLPSPDDLFSRGPQYLIVRDEAGEVTIEGSHSESLELIAAWFDRWTRINDGDNMKRPHFEIEMHYSSWGHESSRRLERLALRRTNKSFYTSVTSVLVVVEGVAGYSRINIQGNSFMFEKQI